jgi:GNAT superfamily N-acetyltransferase
MAATGGRAGLALCRVEGQVQAMGGWRAGPVGPVGHVVDLTKIMVHPDERGLGLGRCVVDALIERAERYGAELLTLGVRGNNHGAQALYEACGFTIWGVLPNGVAVGSHRFDVLRMYRQLRLPASAVIHGSSAGGVGGSPSISPPDQVSLRRWRLGGRDEPWPEVPLTRAPSRGPR